ncbi:unnamed protein product [Calicophoron daubneyi]|uniref:NTF2 domain-containing protein n=1 Tax=Calicophoron daubneyi TaxID=300641 RepID=A0AAV2TX84_CALDB
MGAGENNSSVGGAFTVSRMDPSDVLNLAGEFVMQYYTVLRKCPSGLHRFYKDDSAMIRESATVFGQKMIHEKIMSLNLHDSRVGILCLDALRANGNSVLIQVSGEISTDGNEFRRFMQSFVLCEQAPCDFYVVNDIFQYQDHVYGDVKSDSFIASAEERSVVSQPVNDFPANNARCNLPVNNVESNENVHWDRSMASELSYSRPGNTASASHTEEENPADSHPVSVEPPDTSTAPVSPHPMPSPTVEEPVAAPAPPQTRSWAQMASKQPPQNAITMQSMKSTRTAAQPTVYQNTDEAHKIGRTSGLAPHNPQTQRGRGVRQQQGLDGRAAAGDHGFSQENRPAGQGQMRMSSGRGGPMGGGMRGRGGRGGMGPNMMGGRGAAAAPRRGQ